MSDEECQQGSVSLQPMSRTAAKEYNQSSKSEAVYDRIRKMVDEEALNHSSHPTIFRVPHHFRNSNPSAFTPRCVSIGPIHRADDHLQQMEGHKRTYMYALFTRAAEVLRTDMEQIMRRCVDVVLPMVQRIRACYVDAASFFSDDLEWATMMVVDGCFVLEFLYRCYVDDNGGGGAILEGDPIFSRDAAPLEVRSDLILIENQIPFFVLQELFSLTLARLDGPISLDRILYYVVNDFAIAFEPPPRTSETICKQNYDHIIGYLQDLCYQPTQNCSPDSREETWYSASQLARAGVKFGANKNSCDVGLVTTPVCWFPQAQLKLPAMYMHLYFEIFLRNLTAYEMFSSIDRHYVISYVILMNRLMKTEADVELLERSQVLTCDFSSHEDVRDLFMRLSSDVVTCKFIYYDMLSQLKDHCNRFGPRLRLMLAGGLTKTRENIIIMTSWKTAAVIGMLALFVLTIVQTIYTVRAA